jgi:hypothetical protein
VLHSILPSGARLTIEITGVTKVRWPELQLDAPLHFMPGKEGRLECASVQTRVSFIVADLQACVEKAARIGTDPESVQIFPDQRRVEIQVASLSQAYPFASRRLVYKRRSRTGQIYDKLAWIAGRLMHISLGEIRRAAEAGNWSSKRSEIESSLGAWPT